MRNFLLMLPAVILLTADRIACYMSATLAHDLGALVRQDGGLIWGFSYLLHVGFMYDIPLPTWAMGCLSAILLLASIGLLRIRIVASIIPATAGRIAVGLGIAGLLCQAASVIQFGGAVDYLLFADGLDGVRFIANIADLMIVSGAAIFIISAGIKEFGHADE